MNIETSYGKGIRYTELTENEASAVGRRRLSTAFRLLIDNSSRIAFIQNPPVSWMI